MASDISGARDIWTHDVDGITRPHEWQYLGRVRQEYRCAICQYVVTKTLLKAETDA